MQRTKKKTKKHHTVDQRVNSVFLYLQEWFLKKSYGVRLTV